MTIERKWYSADNKKNEEDCEEYFRKICSLLVGHNHTENLLALHILENDCRIGSIIDWFYNFAYFLLSYHSACEHLTICAFSLIESLEGNPTTDISISGRQVNT